MDNVILEKAVDFKAYVADLKNRSTYYPHILIESKDGVTDRLNSIYASTILRIQRDSTWYKVHIVESIVPTKGLDDAYKYLMNQFARTVYLNQTFYCLCGREEVDQFQISEEERLNPQS
jgi:hypothetical protein